MLETQIDQLLTGIVGILLTGLTVLVGIGVRYVQKRMNIADAELTLNAQTLLNATLEANVREQEQIKKETVKAGGEKPRGEILELNAINGTIDDLKVAARKKSGNLAKRALDLATSTALRRGVKGLVQRLF